MSYEHDIQGMPFLESTFENRPIIARWGPALVHIGESTRRVMWAMLIAKGQSHARTFVWSEDPGDLKRRSIGSVQANRGGVFVGRHPMGVPVVLIEDWTYLDDTSGVIWG